jgi:hypothetical protein
MNEERLERTCWIFAHPLHLCVCVREREIELGMLRACKGAHTLFTGQRERDKEGELEREKRKEEKGRENE